MTPVFPNSGEAAGLALYVSDDHDIWWVRCDRGVTARSAAKEVAYVAGPDHPIAAYIAKRVRADVGEEGGEPRIWPTEHGTEEYYEVTLRPNTRGGAR